LNLQSLGWDSSFADAFEPHAREGLIAGRVATQHRGVYEIFTEFGSMSAQSAGALVHTAAPGALPAVGDWVALHVSDAGPALVRAVLPRRTEFVRKAATGTANRTEHQVLAANVDTVFLVSSLGRDLNVRRLERYVATAWESGGAPVIVLTKLDLVSADEAEVGRAEVEATAFGVPVHAVSALTGEGMEALEAYLAPGRTVALLGSSGVGKSTLVNRLAGRDLLETSEIRSDGRGRHTTTHRELVPLPGGALLLDTPGLRELQLWEADEGLDRTFEDVAALAATCRFNDCGHGTEPGCAVRAALADGSLAADRWESYLKLERELRALAVRQDARLASDERKKRRAFARSLRNTAY
jgi:ribosome biogenesis GTPase